MDNTFGIPFHKQLREGQKKALQAVPSTNKLNIKLPTGYGKTYTNMCVYSMLKKSNRATRQLTIFPTVKQLEQFVKDGPANLRDSCIDGPKSVVDIGFYGMEAVVKHMNDKAQIFAVTIQSLTSRGRGEGDSCGTARRVVNELLKTGKWMITPDEYHHYGLGKTWGNAVLSLPCEFLLAMSATPYRLNNDEALGPPDIEVSYRHAAEVEKAVKPLKGHAYNYRLDAIMENGDVRSYTTKELIEEVGSDSPEEIEKFAIRRKMRWSPKYVSPLVRIPIDRMVCERLRAPGGFLQSLVKSMCVSHAKTVCQQIKVMYPELRVDWVGSGPDGRPDEDNRKILQKFCPEMDDNGQRHPELDVLVQFNMAGEGLDSIHVSEVIFLCPAGTNNSSLQTGGRASRYMEDILGQINFDASSDFSKRGYIGSAFMDAMDLCDPHQDEDEEEDKDGDGRLRDLPPIPDEPNIVILNLELDGIDSGDPEVNLYRTVLLETGKSPFSVDQLLDETDPCQEVILAAFKAMRRKEAEEHNEPARIEQWKEAVKSALRTATGLAIRILYGVRRVESSIAGDVKKRINRRKKYELHCEITNNIDVCKRHYQWLQKLDKQIREDGEVPGWLQ